MNKLELIQALKDGNGLSKTEAESVVNLFFNTITDVLAKGERVEIRGLCSIFVKEYKPYTGRNPRTGEQVQIATKKLPFFKAGKELKERVDRKTRMGRNPQTGEKIKIKGRNVVTFKPSKNLL